MLEILIILGVPAAIGLLAVLMVVAMAVSSGQALPAETRPVVVRPDSGGSD